MAFHTRSNSFPSRPHPIVQEVDERVCRLRSSEATSTSSSSISHKLSGLQDLHDCVDRLLQLPLTQQALAQEQNEKWANELLDGSLRLLDVCSSAKDAILQTKECAQDLQSIIRRTRGGESAALTSEVRKYLTSRKTVKRAIQKAMKNLKGSNFSSLNKDNESIDMVNKLREVEAVTLAVFDSLLSFISGQITAKQLVLGLQDDALKKVALKKNRSNNVCTSGCALNSLIGHKTCKSQNKSVDNAQNQLEQLESCIQDQEEGVECVFRQIIKTRVSLLNILNH
ncbi:uncharacterized protein Pyn_01857 [Prunus yedoensis var. nudiflora]|uniref:DUF241 domain protein n=1 Tax=Prunus yedoensis var. nudiflora TaxID=2094558 RepID=A0A314U6M8_PRUYE|nr:uncharacterized protein Pyn_01857 [Prunus yedoensis var. nudiflora]